MKKLEINDTIKVFGKGARKLALIGTISASTIFFSGCGLDDVTSVFQGKEGDEDVAFLEKDGQILQLLRLSSGKTCAWKVGYFSLEDENLHFHDAFEDEDTNLSYLLTLSDNMKIDFCDYANICNTEVLLSCKVSKVQSDDILSNLAENEINGVEPSSEYSCKELVELFSIKDYSYDDIIKNSSVEKVTQKKKK